MVHRIMLLLFFLLISFQASDEAGNFKTLSSLGPRLSFPSPMRYFTFGIFETWRCKESSNERRFVSSSQPKCPLHFMKVLLGYEQPMTLLPTWEDSPGLFNLTDIFFCSTLVLHQYISTLISTKAACFHFQNPEKIN